MINRLQLHCLDLGDTNPDDAALLSSEERQRAERFAFPHLHRRFVSAHSAMRRRLGQVLNVPPDSLQFEVGAQGKPILPAFPHLAFNLSHSEDLAVLALWINELTAPIQLGVDVEAKRTSTEFYAMSRRYFAPAEQASLPSPLNPEFCTAFLRLWTHKEAVTKCLGTGLRTPLTSFDTCSNPPKFPRSNREPKSPPPSWLRAGHQVKWLRNPAPASPLVTYEIDFAAWGAPELADKFVAALCLSGTTSEDNEGELVGLS